MAMMYNRAAAGEASSNQSLLFRSETLSHPMPLMSSGAQLEPDSPTSRCTMNLFRGKRGDSLELASRYWQVACFYFYLITWFHDSVVHDSY